MLHKLQCFIALVLLAALVSAPAYAQEEEPVEATVPSAELEYTEIQPEGFEPGMKIATIQGDPAVADEEHVVRLSFPDGYRIPPHYYANPENLTVISGKLLLAMGQDADESTLESYQPGDSLYVAPEDPHFGKAKGETVIQLQGTGAFEILLPEE